MCLCECVHECNRSQRGRVWRWVCEEGRALIWESAEQRGSADSKKAWDCLPVPRSSVLFPLKRSFSVHPDHSHCPAFYPSSAFLPLSRSSHCFRFSQLVWSSLSFLLPSAQVYMISKLLSSSSSSSSLCDVTPYSHYFLCLVYAYVLWLLCFFSTLRSGICIWMTRSAAAWRSEMTTSSALRPTCQTAARWWYGRPPISSLDTRSSHLHESNL